MPASMGSTMQPVRPSAVQSMRVSRPSTHTRTRAPSQVDVVGTVRLDGPIHTVARGTHVAARPITLSQRRPIAAQSLRSSARPAPIVKQLTDQPELSLRIWGLVDPRTDGMKLRSTALRDSFAIKLFGTGAKGEQLTKEQLEQQMIVAYNELLASKAAAENKPAPALVGPNSEVQAPAVAVMEQALVESAPNPTEHLIVLAQQRQDAIKKYLIEKREFNPIRVRTVGVAPQFMETERPSAVLQVGR